MFSLFNLFNDVEILFLYVLFSEMLSVACGIKLATSREQGSATEELQQGSPRLLVMALLNKAVIRNSFSLLGGLAWGYIGVVTEVLVTLSDYFWNMHAAGMWALLAEPGLVMDYWAVTCGLW